MAIPVSSDQKPTNPVRPHIVAEISDNARRLSILERSGNKTLEERLTAAEDAIAAIELFLFGP